MPPSIDSIRSVRSLRLKQPKLNIRAGFNDTLLVYGQNFTNTMQIALYNVLYDTDYNTYDPGNGRFYNSFKYFTIDQSDYITGRTANLIKIVIPSTSIQFLNASQNRLRDNGCAGSGKVRIYSDSLTRFRQVDTFLVESTEALHIEYARLNDINNSGVKVPFISTTRGCLPQYPVVLNNNIPSNWQPYIKKAFREWNKALGMPVFAVENTTTPDTFVNGKLVIHKINYATFGLMSTEYDGVIPTANDLASARFSGRIYIGTVKKRLTLPTFTTSWVLDSTFTQGITTATSRDFYSDILHEIGHFLNLDHSIDSTLTSLKELMYFKDIAPITATERVSLTSGGAHSLKGANDCIISSGLIPLTNDADLRSYGEWLPQPSKINHCTGATTKTVKVINAKAGSTFLWEYSYDVGQTWQACSGLSNIFLNPSTSILGVKKSIYLPNGAQVRCKTTLSTCTITSNAIEIVNAGTAGILPLSNVKCTDASFILNYGYPKGGQYVIASGSNCPNCIQGNDLFVPANIAPGTTKVSVNYVIPSPCTSGQNVTSEDHELNTLCANVDDNFRQLRINGLYSSPNGGNILNFPCIVPGVSQFYASVSATAYTGSTYSADTFKIQLSDASGNFPPSGSSRIIGKYRLPAAAERFDKSILCTFPSNTASGLNYRIQVINTAGNFYPGNQLRNLPSVVVNNSPIACNTLLNSTARTVEKDAEEVSENTAETGLIIDMDAPPVVVNPATTNAVQSNIQNTAQKVNSILIYPNPNKTNQLTVTFPSDITNTPIQINVMDIQGKLMTTLTQNTTEQIHNLDLPSGVYILSANANNQLFVQKLVVLK